jgi:DNA-binding Lrp family transcriptional regulator
MAKGRINKSSAPHGGLQWRLNELEREILSEIATRVDISRKEKAEMLGLHRMAYHARLKVLGIEERSKKDKAGPRVNNLAVTQALAAVKSGMSITQAAKDFGTSKRSIISALDNK